jgi:hypothetical protein
MASNVLCLGARHDPEAVTEPFHVKPLRALDPRGVVPDVGIVLEKKRAVHELDPEYALPLELRPLRRERALAEHSGAHSEETSTGRPVRADRSAASMIATERTPTSAGARSRGCRPLQRSTRNRAGPSQE